MRGECAQKLDGAWGTDHSFEVMHCGGFHLVVTEVVPVGGGADEKVYFHKSDLRIASDCIDFDLLMGKFSGEGMPPSSPKFQSFSFKSHPMRELHCSSLNK